jgi:hypothetical protein
LLNPRHFNAQCTPWQPPRSLLLLLLLLLMLMLMRCLFKT